MKTFNMSQIGRRISKLRKEQNLTQVELADKLGITYQAVSNWERGDTMPDISKLAELSEILGVSIDELLENNKQAKVIKQIINEEVVDLQLFTKEELGDFLPLVKPSQFEKSFNDYDDIPFELFIILLPYLDEEQVDDWAMNKINNDAEVKWIVLVPFMSNNAVNKVFEFLLEKKGTNKTGWVASFAPFIDSHILESHILNIYESDGLSTTIALVPFVSSDIVDKLIEKAFQLNRKQDVIAFMPFANSDLVIKNIFNSYKHNK